MVTAAPTFLVLIVVGIFVLAVWFFRSDNKGLKFVGGGLVLAFFILPFLAYLRVSEVTDSRNSGLQSYRAIPIQHPPQPDLKVHDDYVADMYSSSEEAAKSLARRLAAALQTNTPQPAISVSIDREKSVNVGRHVDETAEIMQAFEDQLRARECFEVPAAQEVISVAMRRLATSDEAIHTLSISYERSGDVHELKADFTDKIWVRQPNDLAHRPGAPDKFFVASGPGSETEDSKVVEQVAAAVEGIVRVNWYSIPNVPELDQGVIDEVARKLVTDRFSQRFVSTNAGTPLDPADEKLFLLVNYSDHRVRDALQSVSASRATIIPGQTATTWRTLFFNLGSLIVLCFLVTAVYLALQAVSRKIDHQDGAIVARNGT